MVYVLLDPIIITIAIGSCREYSNLSHILSHWYICLCQSTLHAISVLRSEHELSQFARQTVSLPAVSHEVIVAVLVHVPVHAHGDLYLDHLHLPVLVEPLHLDGDHLLRPLLL